MATRAARRARASTSSSVRAEVLHRHPPHQPGFRPKKRLGQHFLIDEAVLEDILSAAQLSRGDIVIEVGPGLGVLTEALARCGARVIAVELDPRLAAMLRKRLSSFTDLKIIHADILETTAERLLQDYQSDSATGPDYKVIANLPYNIASPALRHFLEGEPRPSQMVVMVQREVGEAIAATPGRMSVLSVRTQFFCRPSIIRYVPAASFDPPPKVESAVLHLEVYSRPPIEVSDAAGFFEMVTHGFSLPRKQLRNSLAHALQMSASQVALTLESAGIEPKRRAETLSLAEWREVWEAFAPLVSWT